MSADTTGLYFLAWACHGIAVFKQYFGVAPTEIELRLTPLSLPQVLDEAPHLLHGHKIGAVPVRLSECPAECGDIEIIIRNGARMHTRQAGLDRIIR